MIDGERVLALMGAVAALECERERLIGLPPAGKVTYPAGPPVDVDVAPLDSNHGCFS